MALIYMLLGAFLYWWLSKTRFYAWLVKWGQKGLEKVQ